MGGSNSVENASKTVVESITNSIVNVSQTSSNVAKQLQSVNVNCDNANAESVKLTEACLAKLTNVTPELLDACKNYRFACGGKDLTIKGFLTVDMTSDQRNSIARDVSENITNTLKQTAEQSNGILEFGNSTKNYVETNNKSITNMITNIIQNSNASTLQSQTLNINGGTLDTVSVESYQKFISKTIADNSEYTKLVNDIANNMMQDAKQSSGVLGSLLNNIFLIIGGIVAFMIVFGILLWMLKRKNSQDDEESNFGFRF